MLELGSGGGFLSEYVPDAIRSDVYPYSWLDLALDGQALPFRDRSLRGIVMTNVLHHMPRPALFFDEAARCVRPQGVVAMVEPWFTPWSGFVYRHFHHEPFQPEAQTWEAPPGGPLSGANGALPWIILLRDRARFRSEHPQWAIRTIEPVMPISYLLTGGFTFRSPVPGRLVSAVVRAERRWTSLSRRLALFAVILLERETAAS